MVAGVEAAAAILEGGEVDLSGDSGDELPAWMIFVIVVGFIVGPLGLVLVVYYVRRRCPKCHKFTLRQESQRVLSVTQNYRLVEYTYVCSSCGAVVKRQARNFRDDNFSGGAAAGRSSAAVSAAARAAASAAVSGEVPSAAAGPVRNGND